MRLTRLDFITASAPVRGWRAVLMTIGVGALLTGALHWMAQKDAVDALETQLAQARPAAAAKPVRSAAQQRELENQAKAVREAVRQLNLPIGDLIRILQPPKDIRVALLGLDIGGKSHGDDAHPSGMLRISAEARTPQEMMSYAAFLGDQPLFESVYLIKHELNAASAEKSYRFLLEAQWRE